MYECVFMHLRVYAGEKNLCMIKLNPREVETVPHMATTLNPTLTVTATELANWVRPPQAYDYLHFQIQFMLWNFH